MRAVDTCNKSSLVFDLLIYIFKKKYNYTKISNFLISFISIYLFSMSGARLLIISKINNCENWSYAKFANMLKNGKEYV